MSYKLVVVSALFVSLVPFASLAKDKEIKETSEGQSDAVVEKSSSRNPITGTTTDKYVRKDKKNLKRNDHSYTSEDEVSIKKTTSADGKKTETERVEKTTEKQN